MKNERWILFILAAIQFTNIMDFMIMMPLGPQLMRIFGIKPAEFSIIVSSYTLSAGVFGFLSAFIIDRFDRKKALLTAFLGFGLGTWLCAYAPSYIWLVTARIFTGMFGGSLGAIILSLIGDLIPFERRGSAMGMVMAGFSIASVAGVPTGLFLANAYNWQAPFIFLGIVSIGLTLAIYMFIPSVREHLDRGKKAHTPIDVLRNIAEDGNQQRALWMMITLVLGQFTIIPFIAPYMVSNVGFSENDLTYIYLFGGGATIFTSPLIGKLADKVGKLKVFNVFACLNLIPVLMITYLKPAPISWALCITTLFFVFTGGRMIPAMTLISSAAKPAFRGSFMSISSSMQQLASGVASLLAGQIIVKNQQGMLENYPYVGWLAVCFSLVCILIAQRVKPAV